MALSGSVKTSFNFENTRIIDLSSAVEKLSKALNLSFDDGADVNQVNLLWSDTRTIAATEDENLDLAGSLTDIYGQTLTFARIKGILVVAHAGNTNNVELTRPSSNGVPLFLAASDGLAIQPGGAFLWVAPTAAGVVVTASTGDLVNLANSGSGSSVTYDIVIIGSAT